MITFITKHATLYGAYAPEFELGAWGACEDEAINNLAEDVRSQNPPQATGEERK